MKVEAKGGGQLWPTTTSLNTPLLGIFLADLTQKKKKNPTLESDSLFIFSFK